MKSIPNIAKTEKFCVLMWRDNLKSQCKMAQIHIYQH